MPQLARTQTPTTSSSTMTPPSSKKSVIKSVRLRLGRVGDAVTSRFRSPGHPPTPPEPEASNELDTITDVVRGHFHGSSSQPTLGRSPAPAGTESEEDGKSIVDVNPKHSQSVGLPTSSQQSSSASEHRTSDKWKKAWNVTWSGLETALRLLEKSSDAFPPLKSAVGGLIACLDLGDAVTENHEEYIKLGEELKELASTLQSLVIVLAADEASGNLLRIVESIENESAHNQRQQDRGRMESITQANADQGDVIRRYRRVESLFRQLQSEINLRTLEYSRKVHENQILGTLSVADEARYNSFYSTTIKRRRCTAETRESILEDLRRWVMDPQGKRVFWMNGMAGTGKTTITYSFCEWLMNEARLLGGNFCCSRISSSCRNVSNIVPTLVYQLAQYSLAFRTKLCKILEANPEFSTLDVTLQFRKILQEPILAVKTAMPDNVVIVIDALDECEDGEAFRLFLEALLSSATDLPIKFFLTSRPEPDIRKRMLTHEHSRSVIHLHDIEASIVEADIIRFLTEALAPMSQPPSQTDIKRLAKNAGKLFIYAATAVRYINHPGGNARTRLQAILGMVPSSTKQHAELDDLYKSILSAAFNEGLEEQELNKIRLILWTVICAKEPMTVQTLASLYNLNTDEVRSAAESLQSVLHVGDGIHGLISPFHASFPDYLTDINRSGKFGWHCNPTQHSEVMAEACFGLMKKQLCFNICKLKSSFVRDKDVPELHERIKEFISPALSYACRYWGEHLSQGNFSRSGMDELLDFLRHRLLFWIEVLNLEQRLVVGSNMLGLIQGWLPKDPLENDSHEQIADAKMFITRFEGGACSNSTPHIYISALSFCPRTNSVFKNYWGCTRGLMDVRGSVMEQWPSAAIGIWHVGSIIWSIAISPDGTHVVSGSDDGIIWRDFSTNISEQRDTSQAAYFTYILQ